MYRTSCHVAALEQIVMPGLSFEAESTLAFTLSPDVVSIQRGRVYPYLCVSTRAFLLARQTRSRPMLNCTVQQRMQSHI